MVKIETWFLLSLGALVFWSGWAFFPKLAGANLNPRSIMVYQEIGFIIVTAAVLVSMNFRPDVHTKGIFYAALSGVLGAAGTVMFLYALRSGKISIIVPMTALYPALVLALSFLVLKESISLTQGLGLLAALLAMVLFAL